MEYTTESFALIDDVTLNDALKFADNISEGVKQLQKSYLSKTEKVILILAESYRQKEKVKNE